MKKIAVIIVLFLAGQILASQLIWAEDEAENSAAASSELTLQVSSLPELKLSFMERFVFPFLRGEGPLSKDNNVALAAGGEITPVSFNGIAEAVWTPLAFFQLSAGGRAGSGWSVKLFGGDIHGIGLNTADSEGRAVYSGSALDGLLWKAKAGAALQADLAAIFPGDWHHVVVRNYHEINYAAYTRAAKHESWYYENDDGENCNGFNYYSNFLLGYQMPLFLSMAALLAEADLYLYNTPGRGQWGDEKIRWKLSGVLSFTFNEQLGLSFIAQWRTRKNYEESNWEELYYRERHITGGNPLHWEFYRAAAALTYRF